MFREKKQGVERTSGIGYQFLSEVTCQVEGMEKRAKAMEWEERRRVQTAAGDRAPAGEQDVWHVCDMMKIN